MVSMNWKRKLANSYISRLILVVILIVAIFSISTDSDFGFLEKATKFESANIYDDTNILTRNNEASADLLSPICFANYPVNSPLIPRTTIYFITPTYWRLTQLADLTRLGQTLRLVPGLVWILIEDAEEPSAVIKDFLDRSCVHYVLLASKSRARFAHKAHYHIPGKGIYGRQKGLDWIRNKLDHNPDTPGVFFFGDDDNTYDIELFNYMRRVKRIGIWPAALVGGALVEKPEMLDSRNRVVKWGGRFPKRSFAVDMAAFAVNLAWFKKLTKVNMSICPKGGIEPCFLQQMKLRKEMLEVYAMKEIDGMDRVLVWHTKTSKGGVHPTETDRGYIV